MIQDQANEARRVDVLRSYNLLDTAAEDVFDRVTNIARNALNMPVSLITLIDKDRQWFKSKQGTEICETPRNVSFCSYAIEETRPMIIEDLRKDSRFKNNPFVTSPPYLRFYCGIPLRAKEGYNLGTLCVLGAKARRLKPQELSILTDLARLTINEIETRQVVDVDYLTGIAMRRILMRDGDKALLEAKKNSGNFGLIVFEIDYFKEIVSKCGFPAAETLLKETVAACSPLLRTQDVFARIADERFAVLLPEAHMGQTQETASKIETTIKTLRAACGNQQMTVSCSIGATTYTPADLKFNMVYTRAEIAFYQAKATRAKAL